jgi:hypothetical protein
VQGTQHARVIHAIGAGAGEDQGGSTLRRIQFAQLCPVEP